MRYGGRVSRVPLRTVRVALRYGGRVSRVPLRTVRVALRHVGANAHLRVIMMIA